jgi:hypothetical protein
MKQNQERSPPYMSDVNVDPSVLHERSDTYSSLTDIYGVEVFTDEFRKKVEDYQQEQQDTYNNIKEEIFIKSPDADTDPYSQVTANLFMDDNWIVKEAPPEEKSDVIAALPIVAMVCIMTYILLLQYVEKRRKKWREYEADADLYE